MSKQPHYKIGCDAHKHYSLFAVLDQRGRVVRRTRVDHERGAVQTFLCQFPPGTPVALETVGNWDGSSTKSKRPDVCPIWRTPPRPM